MELGALICTARQPACDRCPIASSCRWLALGRPEGPPPRRQPKYVGSDRQARGALLAVLREAGGPVRQEDLDAAWPEAAQRSRALDGLVADGLVVPAARRRWALPG
jgi:A/G-specific adenine glycosylase